MVDKSCEHFARGYKVRPHANYVPKNIHLKFVDINGIIVYFTTYIFFYMFLTYVTLHGRYGKLLQHDVLHKNDAISVILYYSLR